MRERVRERVTERMRDRMGKREIEKKRKGEGGEGEGRK